MRVSARQLVASLAAIVFLAPAGAVAIPPPVSAPDIPPLQLMGLSSLERYFWTGSGYVEAPGRSGTMALQTQMMGVLAALQAARTFPDQATFWAARAEQLFSQTQSGYYPAQGYYARTLPAPDRVVCIDLEANAWALLAALGLSQEGRGVPSTVQRRITEGQAVLRNLLDHQRHGSETVCNSNPGGPINPFLVPVALMALLDARGATGSTSNDGAVRATLDELLAKSFDQGFRDGTGFYHIVLNARMLVVLQQAAGAFPSAPYAAARDRLAGFLLNETIVRSGPRATATSLQVSATGLNRVEAASPPGQAWTLFALAHQSRLDPSRVPAGLLAALSRTYVADFWSTSQGTFVSEHRLLFDEPNILAAFLTQGPRVTNISFEPATVGWLVPATSRFVYPAPLAACEARRCEDALYMSNTVAVRFTLAAPQGAPTAVLLPSWDLGPLNLSQPASRFHPAPRLFRLDAPAGPPQDVALSPVGDSHQVLDFSTPLGPNPVPFRLEAFAPVEPLRSSFEAEVRLVVRNTAYAAFVVQTLQVDLAATGIQVTGISVNGVPFANYRIVDGVVTPQFDRPHQRLLFTDVPLPARSQTEFVITYQDTQGPTVGTPVLSRDRGGLDRLTGPQPEILRNEETWVRAIVRDNAALRTVLVQCQLPDQLVEVAMTEDALGSGLFLARLPCTGRAGAGTVIVRAVDWKENLADSQKVAIEVVNPLLAGEPVLLVFAATLFAASVAIWFKVRRRARKP